MFGTYSFWLTLLTTALFLIFSCPGGADVVDHHGSQVESDSDHFECLSCHDGAVSHSIEYCNGNCGGFVHPVDKVYPPRGKEQEYAPIGQLQWKGIKFQKEKVSCVSCHDLKNKTKNHMVEVQDLCLACHIKK